MTRPEKVKIPLHGAAFEGHGELVAFLLAYGANVDATAFGDYSRTPLHKAALGGHRDVVDLLLAHKADVNIRDRLGCTPLHYASPRIGMSWICFFPTKLM